MRRNNGWLAVLAVSLVLSILRNSLAGERHPLDYGNAELPVNRSNTAYKPSSRNQNPLSPPIPSSSHAIQIPRSTQQKGIILSSKERTKAIPYPPSNNLVQTNRPDEEPVYDLSIPENRRESKLVQRPRNNPRRTIETRLRETTSLRPNIPEQPRSSSWIPRAVIKGRSRRINSAKHGEPARDRKTTTTPRPPVTIRGREGAVLDEGTSYYGHVVPSDDESLTTTSGAPSSRDPPPDLEIERVNGVESGVERDIIGSSNLDGGKIVRKRYLTGYSLFSITINRRANTRNKLTLGSRRRLKNRRGARSIYDRDKRRTINNLGRRGDGESRIKVEDTWYFSRHGDGDSRNDGFDEEYNPSRMEDLQRGISRGSMGAVRYESTRQLNGTSKRILAVDNDRDGTRSIDSARSKRNIVSVDDGVAFESSNEEENSWNVTLYGASNGVDNMEEELKFDFSRDNVTDGLLDDRMFSSSVTDVASDNESYFVRRSIGENSNVDGSKESSLNCSRSKDEARSTNIMKNTSSVDGLEDSSARNSSKLDNESYSTSRNIGRNFKVDGSKDRKSVRNVSKSDDGSSAVGENSVDGSISNVPNENYPVLMSNDSMSRDASTNSTTEEAKLEKSSVDKNRSTTNETDWTRYNASSNERTKLQESNIQRGNDTGEWNNEFRSMSHDDTITDSINGTKLRDLNGNYSQLMENKFRSESRQNLITDLINDTPNKSYLHVTSNDKSRFIVQDTNRISNSSSEKKSALNFSDTIVSSDSNDKQSTSNAPDKIILQNDTKFTLYSSSTIINSNVSKLNDSSSKGGEELETSKTINSQLADSKLANSNNKSKDRTDGTELGARWAEIDGNGEASIKPVSQETSMLSSVTKGSKNVLENSVRGSVAAPRNPAYLKHDANSLAEGGFVFESTGLSEFEEKNANDPFVQASSTITEEGRKLVENSNSNSNALPELPSINHEMESKRSFPFERNGESFNITVISRKDEDSRKKIKGGKKISVGKETHESSSSNGYNEAKNFQGSLNDFLIVPGGEKSEEGLEFIGMNRGNIEENFQEIRKESIASVSPSNEEVITINSLEDGIIENMDPVFLEEVTDSNRPSKGRKSRSSKVRASTSSNSKYNPTAKAEDRANDQTSASTWNKDGIVANNVPTPSIDSTVNGWISEPDNGIRETLQLPESISNSSFRSTISISSATKDDHPTSLTDVTLSPIEIDQLPSPTLINEKEEKKEEEKKEGEKKEEEEEEEEEDRSYVTPYEGNYQDFRATVDSISRNADNSSHETEPQWPVKHSAVVEGDLVLGGLMMVHEREDNVTCGPVMPQGGVQALEAMLYTLDKLNDRGIVPGVKIGAHILDDCDKDTYGLEMAVDFIKGSISNIDGAEDHCNKTAVRKVISGVVGAASSVTSIQVANLLRLFRIPQVSFFSTSPELSNKQRFEYFTRTIPSDHYQVKAMVEIVMKMKWSYVSIIYEESNYGIKAFEELEELLGKRNICIAIKEKLVKDSGVAKDAAYDNIVLKLLTKPRARGCIIFGSDQEVAGVMRAVKRCNATGAFSWIGSDGWSARGLVSDGNEAEVEGTLSVQPQANPVKGFEEYFLNLTVENNRRNPWFVEFWEHHFQCKYPNASITPYNKNYTKFCTTEKRLTKQNTAFENQLQFVSDAVMAFAYAFRDMHKELCDGKPGLCDAMKPTKGTELLKYLRKVDFEGLSGDKFKFDKNGDGPARYNIIHFKQIEPGKYEWVRVGKYLSGELRLNMSAIQFKLGHPEPPESVCSLPCEVGQAKKYVAGEQCCWHCFNCTQYQIRDHKDVTQCISCRQGTVPDETHSACRDIPEEFLRPESGWAIGAMSFSATGILITLFVCGVFLKHNDTPVVRASGRELSYVLLSGILLCYLVTFALVLRPTDIVCGIQRFAAGFCFTVVYAALLTKTNRISRIFNASKHSAKRPSFISPRSQLIICSGLVFVQILINGVWMIIDPAKAMHHYPTREDNLLVCNSYIDASYMIAFAYPIMLIVVCTVYAVLTRKIPEAFNESKHIGFTMYTTCVIWLAFVPLYFGTGNNVALRITSMSVTISLSASVTIACLFSPKLYIILIRPERNVRQSMMPTRYSTTKSSAVTATNASSMIAPVALTAATCDQNKAVKKHITTTIDCSTQSEYYELEVKDQKNGKPPSVVSRSTQTSANNDKDANVVVTQSKETKDNTTTTKQLNNKARIGNGPINQSDVPL